MKMCLIHQLKAVFIPLGLTAAASATDAAVKKKVHISRTTLIISNEEIQDIKKLGSLIKGVSETIENEAKESKF